MIIQKNEEQIKNIRIACQIVAQTHTELKKHIKVGITTKELDKIAYDFIISKGATPSCLGYEGYPASICTSVNQVVVHGIPGDYKLKEGDIIGIDLCACYKGFHGDAARTHLVGNVTENKRKLVEVTRECFFKAINGLKAGDRVGKISNAVEVHAKKHDYGIVKELVGHGVGIELHEDPQIPNYGTRDSGELIPVNAVLAIEPMINMGKSAVRLLNDDWTVVTMDGRPSAHYENTVLVKEDGVEILTLMEEEIK